MPTSVLVVDDSSVARKILIRSFPKTWAVDVRQAANGEEALAAYRASRPDIIFLDLNMPVMDGYQFLEALKDEANRPPILVLSGDIQPKAQERVMALGALGFVKKPITEAGLATLLQANGFQ